MNLRSGPHFLDDLDWSTWPENPPGRSCGICFGGGSTVADRMVFTVFTSPLEPIQKDHRIERPRTHGGTVVVEVSQNQSGMCLSIVLYTIPPQTLTGALKTETVSN